MIRIAVKKLLQSYSGQFQLDIDFQFTEGSFIAISGKSGVGKTSLLKILAGLVRPDSGTISVKKDLWFDSSKKIDLAPQRRQIGFVFQDYALFPHMTVRENLTFVNSEKNDVAFVDEILAVMEIESLASRKPSSLSGGQQQRVALARALVRRPAILLLDEPFSSLDNETATILQDVVVRIHKRYQLTTILVSHNTSDIYRLADEVALMEHGKVVKHGRAWEVFHHNEISGKVQLTGEVIRVVSADCLFILYAACGNQVVKVVITEKEASQLKPADKILISSKAFNPVVVKI